jgi:hypothetical protein
MTEKTVIANLAALMGALETAAEKNAPTSVDVPQLGGSVYVLPFTTADILGSSENKPPEEATEDQKRAWGVARCLCDEHGARIVMADNLAALDLIAKLPWDASRRILEAAKVKEGDDPNAG